MLGSWTGGPAERRTGVTLSETKRPKAGLATRIMRTVRQCAGMPDYELHLEHLRRCHPERPIPSPREFYEEYLRARYTDGPTRCC